MPENYTPGYSAAAEAFMMRRRLEPNGAFFLPFLKPGLAVLDCGCGPGTITRDIARKVAPGPVTGLDFNVSQVERAARDAGAEGLGNVEFRQGSVYELPFAASSFDAVFSHALLEHLREPGRAVAEFFRVLRPGGMLGICTPDWGGFLVAPPGAEMEDAFEAYKALQNANGGDACCGRKLGSYAADAGFADIRMSSRYENYDPLTTIGDFLATNFDEAGDGRRAAAWRRWGRAPGGMFSQAWVACTGRKPDR
jgi:SAM-dependent methyltransferase